MNPNITYIKRDLEVTLKKYLNKHKVIVLYGARQVGKTTLAKNLFSKRDSVLYLSCEQSRIQEQITPDALALGKIVGDYKNVILDEAQYLNNPGLILKILIDTFPEKNIIASGSSSFDLAHKLTEPLTGRHYKFLLFPLLLSEIRHVVPPTDIQFHLEQSLIFGTYPEVFKLKTNEEKNKQVASIPSIYYLVF